jgi:DNA repair protein RadA/Sms
MWRWLLSKKRLGMRLGDMDVYVNVVGGVRVHEPALDLGIALAVISSLHDVPVPADACVFGEVGLAGEVRAVSHADRRATEAGRLGFARCIMPRAALAKIGSERSGEAQLQGVSTLSDAVHTLLPRALEKKSGGRGHRASQANGDARRGSQRTGAGADYDENFDPTSNTGAWQPAAARHGAGGDDGAIEYSNEAFGADGAFDDE